VDFPALLPDGSPSQLSVSPVIARAGGPRPAAQLPPGNGTAAEPGGETLEEAERESTELEDEAMGRTGPEGTGAEREEARP
jgi:hypothetical protein